MDPKGKAIDGVGVAPAEPVPAVLVSDFKEGDPVFEEAVRDVVEQLKADGLQEYL